MKIIKNPKRLVLKLFILVWVFLALQIVLKVTFNYWQPYVIPTPQLEAISQFIDNNRWLEILCNGILYVINAVLVILCSIQQWWFKSWKQGIFTFSVIITMYVLTKFIGQTSILTLFVTIGLPLILNYKKWLYNILTFGFSNLFMFLSLWLEGFVNDNQMNYVTSLFLNNDYYIMLILNYMLFNMIDLYALIRKIFKRKKA